jgi:hypothetical protein
LAVFSLPALLISKQADVSELKRNRDRLYRRMRRIESSFLCLLDMAGRDAILSQVQSEGQLQRALNEARVAHRQKRYEGHIQVPAGRIHLARSSQASWLFCPSSRRIGFHGCPLSRFLEGTNTLAPPQSEQLSMTREW